MTTTRTRGTWPRALAVLAALAAIVGTTLVATTAVSATPSPKITICHATAAVANPYVSENVNESSADEARNNFLNGHGDHVGPVFTTAMVQGDHWGDIIPPFTYTYTVKEGKGQDKVDVEKTVTFAGLNWDAAGQAIYNNGCTVPPPPPPPTWYDYTPSATATTTACALVNGTWTAGYGFSQTVTGSVLTKDSPWTDEQKAAENANFQSQANAALAAAMSAAATAGTVDLTGVSCTTTPPTTPPTPPPTEPPETVAPVEPATVAPVEPATVEQPETVAVPAPATVPQSAKPLPATVPAGDGSSVPTVPPAVIALIALGTTAMAASAVRLVRSRS